MSIERSPYARTTCFISLFSIALALALTGCESGQDQKGTTVQPPANSQVSQAPANAPAPTGPQIDATDYVKSADAYIFYGKPVQLKMKTAGSGHGSCLYGPSPGESLQISVDSPVKKDAFTSKMLPGAQPVKGLGELAYYATVASGGGHFEVLKHGYDVTLISSSPASIDAFKAVATAAINRVK